MLGKIITKLYQWYAKRAQEKYKNEKMTDKQRKEAEFVTHLKDLYGFTNWINTQLPNRRAKKSFWRRIELGEAQLETTIKELIDKYTPKEVKK